MTTSSPITDPEHWRDRAATMRELAKDLCDAAMIATMLAIADDYELLAKRAEQRAGAMAGYGASQKGGSEQSRSS